jgi:hypothetical protein
VCHARLDGNSGERDRLWRVHCHSDFSQIIRRNRSIDNADRSALVPRRGAPAALTAKLRQNGRLAGAFGYPQQIHRGSKPKFLRLIRRLLRINPHYSQPRSQASGVSATRFRWIAMQTEVKCEAISRGTD